MATPRILSIDVLRGLIMVIMVLDHVRDYFGYGFIYTDPTNMDTTNSALFFTRWITHFCAPLFVFLSGTSAFFHGVKLNSKPQLSRFLFTRGIFLIVLELTIVNFGWTFDIHFSFQIVQVIWAIGFSMIILSAAIHLPLMWIGIVGLAIVFGHNLLDSIQFNGNSLQSVLWYLFHQQSAIVPEKGRLIMVAYPAFAWSGVMLCGYAIGYWFTSFDFKKRVRTLLISGFIAFDLFLLLRLTGIYGDASPWQHSHLNWFLSIWNCTKYPPSLQFLLMTLGPGLGILGLFEKFQIQNRVLRVFGAVPMFFYLIHLYLVHGCAMLLWMYMGGKASAFIITAENLDSGQLSHYGYGLSVVYLVWVLLIAFLYFPCRFYGIYKKEHSHQKWLSYL
ncbi:MAG: DUF1624 domain-containing protein [Bacteroidetes bacterium]|nr:DUF1624 domain-containing protein [Bacteroidota bacterium]